MLTSRVVVLRYRSRHEFGGVQRLERHWFIFGVRVWRQVLDEEVYPSWADIQRCTLGYTEWRSRFAAHIK